jgi:hypothetical protein
MEVTGPMWIEVRGLDRLVNKDDVNMGLEVGSSNKRTADSIAVALEGRNL